MADSISNQKDSRKLNLVLAWPWILLCIGIVDVGLVSLLRHRNLIGNETVEVLKEFGIAAAIIGLVTLSIEKARVLSFTRALSAVVDHKLEDIKKITRDAILELAAITKDAIYQGNLPREYYEQISKTMLQRSFTQSHWLVELDFEWLPDSEHEFLNIFIDQTYEITNISSFTTRYRIQHYESKDWDHKFPGATSFRYVRAWLGDRQAPSSVTVEGVPEGDSRFSVTPKELRFTTEIDIPSRGILNVEVGTRKILSDRHYEGRFVFNPTLGARFHITAPDNLAIHLEVPEPLLAGIENRIENIKVGEEKTVDGRKTSHWNVTRPLPPTTRLFVIWRRLDAGTAKQLTTPHNSTASDRAEAT